MGGKTRIAKQIAAEIDKVRKPGQLVWDAFCGGLSVSVALSKNGPVLASDACAPLINLYKAVQEGWDPPTEVSKETWQAAKLLPDTDPMKAFCGFGCSFAGKWFGGYGNKGYRYSKGIKYSYASSARNSLLKVKYSPITYMISDFNKNTFPSVNISYLDPPYKNTTSYDQIGEFDHQAFENRVRLLASTSHVFLSEYESSLGFCVLSQSVAGSHGLNNKAIEQLYYIAKQQ